MAASDWWQAAQLAYGIYKDNNPKKPEFEPTPLSPEQRQLYDIYIRSILNPATMNNAAQLNQMASQMLAGLRPTWQSPATFSGQQGYSGSSPSFTPPQSGMGGGNWGQFAPQGPGQEPTPPFDPRDRSPDGGDRTGGYVNGGPFNPDYAPGGVGMGGGFSGSQGFMDAITKVAGSWNRNQETYEKWISRGVSLLAGAMGLPIPAGLIDKGIDAAQWLYRRFAGDGSDNTSEFDKFYNDPVGSGYGSAYGSGTTPPGYGSGAPSGNTNRPGSTTPGGSINGAWTNSGYGGAFGGFGAPGSVMPPSRPPSADNRGGTWQYDPRTGRDQYVPSFGGDRSTYYSGLFNTGLATPGNPYGNTLVLGQFPRGGPRGSGGGYRR